MLDIKEIRRDKSRIEQKLKAKDPEISLDQIVALDEEIRSIKTEVEALKAKKNSASKEVGVLKQRGEDVKSLLSAMDDHGKQIDRLDSACKELEEKLLHALSVLPNIPMDDIKVSPSRDDNVCIKSVGKKPSFSFPFKNHLELNALHHFFALDKSAKMSGSGWPLYIGWGARLEWALINLMLDTHRKNGFVQVIPPLLAQPATMFASAHLPKFESQLFKIRDEDYHLYLLPTSEAALNALHLQETIDEEKLPLKYTAYTPCFRREAGAAGSQERGLIRTHQFNKVELFAFTTPEKSEEMFEEMLKSAEEVLNALGLHYKNMLLTTGDMSFAAAKTVDIEVWLPGQNRYYEVSSVSNCTDFQARRGDIKCRAKNEKGRFLHTLNGSGVATSRLMVALLENNQLPDGSILVPKALWKYLGEEIEVLHPHGIC